MRVCFVVSVLLAWALVAYGAHITNCGGTAQVNTADVKVTGCTGHQRCQFKRNTIVEIELPFSLNHRLDKMRAAVTGTILGIPIPFPLPQGNACEASGLHCPLMPNKQYIYNSSLVIQSIFPTIEVGVNWYLRDINRNNVVCLEFPVTIVA